MSGIAGEFDRAGVENVVRFHGDPGNTSRWREDVESRVPSENDRILRAGDGEGFVIANREFRLARACHSLLRTDLDAACDRCCHEHVASGFLHGKIHRARGGNLF